MLGGWGVSATQVSGLVFPHLDAPETIDLPLPAVVLPENWY